MMAFVPHDHDSKTLTHKPHTHVFPSHMVVIVYDVLRHTGPLHRLSLPLCFL
jgi:hypothetical protein